MNKERTWICDKCNDAICKVSRQHKKGFPDDDTPPNLVMKGLCLSPSFKDAEWRLLAPTPQDSDNNSPIKKSPPEPRYITADMKDQMQFKDSTPPPQGEKERCSEWKSCPNWLVHCFGGKDRDCFKPPESKQVQSTVEKSMEKKVKEVVRYCNGVINNKNNEKGVLMLAEIIIEVFNDESQNQSTDTEPYFKVGDIQGIGMPESEPGGKAQAKATDEEFKEFVERSAKVSPETMRKVVRKSETGTTEGESSEQYLIRNVYENVKDDINAPWNKEVDKDFNQASTESNTIILSDFLSDAKKRMIDSGIIEDNADICSELLKSLISMDVDDLSDAEIYLCDAQVGEDDYGYCLQDTFQDPSISNAIDMIKRYGKKGQMKVIIFNVLEE